MIFSMCPLLVESVPSQRNATSYAKPPAAAMVGLVSNCVALVTMPPPVVLIDCVPPAAPGGTLAERASVPFVTPLCPAALWSVTAVPVPFHEAGKLYEKTGAPRETCEPTKHMSAKASGARRKKNRRKGMLIRTAHKVFCSFSVCRERATR